MLGEPASARPGGASLAFDLLWLGLAYGMIDALLLSVLPVDAVMPMDPERPGLGVWAKPPIRCTAALLASIGVTVAYHAGFPEFRGPEMLGPLMGNAVITLAYLIGMSQLSPIVAHIALHLVAVVHAYSTSAPLPAHY